MSGSSTDSPRWRTSARIRPLTYSPTEAISTIVAATYSGAATSAEAPASSVEASAVKTAAASATATPRLVKTAVAATTGTTSHGSAALRAPPVMTIAPPIPAMPPSVSAISQYSGVRLLEIAAVDERDEQRDGREQGEDLPAPDRGEHRDAGAHRAEDEIAHGPHAPLHVHEAGAVQRLRTEPCAVRVHSGVVVHPRAIA